MSDPTEKYLQALGLVKKATQEEIKKAFKNLAFQYHPDRNPHNDVAEEQFKGVVEAYSYLSGNMEAYQAFQKPAKKTRVSMDEVQDIYSILFDIDLTPAATRPRPLETNLELSLEEAFLGGIKKLYLERYDLCPQCLGQGVEKGAKSFTCTYCFGQGEVEGPAGAEDHRECPKCNGRGFLSSKGCLNCSARGVEIKPVKRKVTVPAKVGPGKVLTLRGEGHEFELGHRGDVFVKLQLKKDSRFSFDGNDIICETTVEMASAALGGEVTVPTLAGSKKVSIPAGTQSGAVIRLKGFGLGGDQFIRVWVRTPQVISEREKNLILRLKDEDGKSKPGIWSRIKKWIW